MISFDLYQYFNINRLLLLAVGLWPYHRTKLVQVQIILISGILTSFIVLQFATFMTAKFTLDLVIDILSITLLFIIHLTKYSTFLIKAKNMRYLLEELERIYSELKNIKEIAIIENYAAVAKRYSTAIALLSIIYIVVVNLLPVWPHVQGIFSFINDTRPRMILTMSEYFLDQEKYFYFTLLHTNATVCIGTLIILATTTMIIGYIKHTCGIFSVASYRMEQAMNINILKNISSKDESMIYKNIIYAVDIHRKALRFSKLIISTFEGMFLFLLVFGVSCLSLNLYRVYQVVTFEFDVDEFILRGMMVFSIFLYIYLLSYIAQNVTDQNEYVFEAVYNIHWYIAPLRVQKMILFLLQKGTTVFSLNFGGMFVACLESASMLTSASISYFTILYSTGQ